MIRRLVLWLAFAVLFIVAIHQAAAPSFPLGNARAAIVPNTLAALTQATWYVDRVSGSPAASGIDSAHPVDKAATIRSRWQGGIAGVRPEIPATVSTITVQWLTQAATQPDTADPISVLFDVDFAGPTKLILEGPTTSAHGGTLATASTFARTSASGQISVTDSGVTDFSPYTKDLFVDSTSGAVAWLYEPQSAGATGKVSKGKAALTPGTHSTPTDAAITAADSYTLRTFLDVYLGSGAFIGQKPTAGSAGGFARIFLYRLQLGSTGGGAFGDAFTVGTVPNLNGASPWVEFQECRIDVGLVASSGIIWLQNSSLTGSYVGSGAIGPTQLYALGGYSYKGMQTDQGATLFLDTDFLVDGNGSAIAGLYSWLYLGDWSRWGTLGPAIIDDGGQVQVQNNFAGHTQYGTVGTGNLVVHWQSDNRPGAVIYPSSNGAVVTFQYDSTGPHWDFPRSGTSAWAFDTATGIFGGAADGSPTTNTWAHLDANVNAPGFGGAAFDPQSGCYFRSDSF